jgi:hypothetical protein
MGVGVRLDAPFKRIEGFFCADLYTIPPNFATFYFDFLLKSFLVSVGRYFNPSLALKKSFKDFWAKDFPP